VKRNGNRMKERFLVVVMVILALAGSSALGATAAMMKASSSDPVQVVEPLGILTVGLGAELIVMELTERFDDPVLDLVQFNTVIGSIDVKLFQAETPLTVGNFLTYVNKGAYTNSFIHRSPWPKFVIQGGGFGFYDFDDPTPDTDDYEAIPKDPPVLNEPGISNVRGTISMAKVGGNPNSATNQWFFNLSDNSANLDFQNGGFTVFGEVINDGMNVVDAIADVPRWDASIINSAFDTLPLIDYANVGILPDEDDLVMVSGIDQIPELSFSVTNDGPDLITASVVDNSLHLEFAEHRSGEANITVRATALDGRFVEDSLAVVVKEWGDLDSDGEVSCADAILALCVQAGMRPSELRTDYASSGADVDGDDEVGISEVAYVLEKICGVRK